MTLKDVAQALGYRTHSHLSAIESGVKPPTVDLVIKVAKFFGVTTDALLNDRIDSESELRHHPPTSGSDE
jgi:transcriptional regulator with XRE-family HTH domain